jgi:hypothetical protein
MTCVATVILSREKLSEGQVSRSAEVTLDASASPVIGRFPCEHLVKQYDAFLTSIVGTHMAVHDAADTDTYLNSSLQRWMLGSKRDIHYPGSKANSLGLHEEANSRAQHDPNSENIIQ